MARRGRSFFRLTATFALLAAGAWFASWGLSEGTLPERATLVTISRLAAPLTVATVVSLVIAVAFRGVEAGLERKGKGQALRPLRRVEAGTAVLVVLLFVFSVFVDVATALVGLGLLGFGLTLALQR
ncbi:MAG: hypothetical protein R3185_01645, partial [Candidatus Thermoplasmatota archaeon]|nr:hypothetical protein [Candidatus Thermoplasmatota archaeon]